MGHSSAREWLTESQLRTSLSPGGPKAVQDLQKGGIRGGRDADLQRCHRDVKRQRCGVHPDVNAGADRGNDGLRAQQTGSGDGNAWPLQCMLKLLKTIKYEFRVIGIAP